MTGRLSDDQQRRMVVLPDLDDELTAAFGVVEQVLLTLRCWEHQPALPAPLAGGAALAALGRVYDAVSPTQGAAGPRLLGPDGRYEHLPLRFIDLAESDVQTLAGAARAFGDPRRSDDVTQALEVTAAALPDRERGTGQLVALTARLAGLLDLAWTGDVAVLHTRIGAAATEDVVLTAGEEAAYQRTVSRLNAMWAAGDPLARFTY